MLAGAAVSLGLAIGGLALAWALYNVADPDEHTDKLGGIKELLYNNYYQDEFQVWVADNTRAVAGSADIFDQGVIDGVVNGVSSVSLLSSERIRRVQSGVVSNYALLLTLGLTTLLVVFGFLGGWF